MQLGLEMQQARLQFFQLTAGLMKRSIESVSSLPLGEAGQAADRACSGWRIRCRLS